MGLTTRHRKAYLYEHMPTSLRSVLGDGWQKWGLPGFDDQGMQLQVRGKDGPVLPCVKREELAQKRGYGRRSIKLLKTGGQEHSESHLLHDLHNLINLCLRIRGSRKKHTCDEEYKDISWLSVRKTHTEGNSKTIHQEPLCQLTWNIRRNRLQ